MRLLLALVALLTFSTAAHAQASTTVHGYTKKNGTHVVPHHRTTPDRTRTNNWSSRPNVNPYTGKRGTHDPYKSRSHSSYRSRSYSGSRSYSHSRSGSSRSGRGRR